MRGIRAVVVEPRPPRPPVPPKALFMPCIPPPPPKPVAVRPAPPVAPVVLDEFEVVVPYLDWPCESRKCTPAPTGPAPVVAFVLKLSPETKLGLPVPKLFIMPMRPTPFVRKSRARSPLTFMTRSIVCESADSSVLSVIFCSVVPVPA